MGLFQTTPIRFCFMGLDWSWLVPLHQNIFIETSFVLPPPPQCEETEVGTRGNVVGLDGEEIIIKTDKGEFKVGGQE